MSDTRVTARVQLTIDVQVGDVWGGDCSMEQVQTQAIESALASIHLAFDGKNGAPRPSERRLVGEPVPVATITRRER